jgi:hypothetical protein
MPVILIPAVVEGAVVGGAWAYRAYQVYRAARAAQAVLSAARALEEMEAAQAAAKPEDKTEEKTESQVKADATTSADCKNCNEDKDCAEVRDKLKKAVYRIKDKDGAAQRGLAERLCHWIFGKDANDGGHKTQMENILNEVKKLKEALEGKREYKNKKQQKNTLKNCEFPADLKEDLNDLSKAAQEIVDGKNIIRLPRDGFSADCTANALRMVMGALGK